MGSFTIGAAGYVPSATQANINVNNGLNLYVPPVIDVTRNSLNDATDANEQTMATFIVPANTLRFGSIVEIWALWENTNSANTKTLNFRWNGTNVGSIPVTTNQSTGFRAGYHIHDISTVAFMNSITGTGGGSLSGLVQAQTITNVTTTINTLTLTCKWAAAVPSEFIRLKHAKVNLML